METTKQITITMPKEFWELGLKYSGFYDQSEVTDEQEWIKSIFRKRFQNIVKRGIEQEEIYSIHTAISDVAEKVSDMDIDLIQ